MAYILSAPGSTNPKIILKTYDGSTLQATGNLTVSSLQDVTLNAGTDVFSWEQLDTVGKFQVPTTSTNSISTTIVVDTDLVFGSNAAAVAGDPAEQLGLLGMQNTKTKAQIDMNIGSRHITADCYVTGINPTVSASSPVWTTPVTFTVDGDYTWS